MNELKKLENVKLRETAGSETFDRYLYQYKYAIYILLEEGNKNNDNAAIIIEYIEDVILVRNYISNSDISYSCYQIKTNNKLQISDITKDSKSSKSILHKLNKSYDNCKKALTTPYSIELISANGFSFCKERTQFNNLKSKHLNSFKIKFQNNEINPDFLDRLYFTTSQIPFNNDTDKLLSGQLVTYIDNVYPNSKTNIPTIKKIILDEAYNKGKKIYDNNKEDNIIEQKGITLEKINQTIENYIDNSKVNQIKQEAAKIIDKQNYTFKDKTKYKKKLEIYKNKSMASDTIEFLLSQIILDSEVLDKMGKCYEEKFLSKEVDDILPMISNRFQNKLNENNEFDANLKETIVAGIFYEFAKTIHC